MTGRRGPVAPLRLEACRRILVVRLSSLGDVVRATGCVTALRAACPSAELVVATGEPLAAVFRHDPAVDRLLLAAPPLPPGRFVRDALRQLAPFRREGGFDLAVDLQGTGQSAIWTYASRARVKAGRGGWRPGWLFSVRPDLRVADVAESTRILQHLGVATERAVPRLSVSREAEESVSARLQSAGLPERGYLAVCPFSRWPAKAWPADRYAAALERLGARGIGPVVLTGSTEEAAQARALVDRLPPGTGVTLAGTLSLDELFVLLGRARGALTGDSGPMHAAAALGVSVVALFGPTWPERAGPEGDGHAVLQRMRLRRYHAYRRRTSVRAMEALGVEEVVDAVARIWERAREGPSAASGHDG